MEYTCQRLENSHYAPLVWEASRPRFLLLAQSHYLLAEFPTRGDVDQISVFALAILLDFTGDEMLALAHYQKFAELLMPDSMIGSNWWRIRGQQVAEFLSRR